MKTKTLIISLSILAILLSSCTAPITASQPTDVIPPATATSVPTIADTATPLPTEPPAPAPTSEPVLLTPSFPEGDSADWSLVASGLNRPVDIVHAGDGSGRLFILEQPGVIRVLLNGQLQPDPFLDLRDRVGSAANEQGLLGIAFHPRFSETGYFYVNYTDYSGDTVISRFTAPDSRQTGDPNSELVLLRVEQPAGNHNGGQLQFDPQGFLWIGLGDGGGQGDPNGYSQSTSSLLGKLLRIDVNVESGYAVPPDNPFIAGGGAPEIMALGLRNPWRFTFDRLTGDLFIADVGQNKWEEINHLPPGFSDYPANFGWNIREGSHPYRETATEAVLIDPVYEYDHSVGCSITGGVVYRGEDLPAFQGVYLFGDFCTGTMWGLIPGSDGGSWEARELFRTNYKIVAFGEDEAGEVYLLDLNGGVYRLTAK